MTGRLAWRTALVAFALAICAPLGALAAAAPPTAPGRKAPVGPSGPSGPSGVARVSALPSAPRITVTFAPSSMAPSGISGSLEVAYRATLSATCRSSDRGRRPCPLPFGTLTWQLDGASTSPGNLTVTTRPVGGCPRTVSSRRPDSSCTVAWPTYGDQWVTARYESDRRLFGGRLHASATTIVELRAPIDLAAGHTFDPYGNTGPGAIDDCTLATAADFIEVTFGVAPGSPAIVASYWAAERTYNAGADAGLTADQLFAYWRHVGIAGTTLTGDVAVPIAEVESYLAGGHVLFATAELPAGFPAGSTKAAAHAWLVVGSSSYGPMIVTWGQELQLSWADFAAWTTGVWAITTTAP